LSKATGPKSAGARTGHGTDVIFFRTACQLYGSNGKYPIERSKNRNQAARQMAPPAGGVFKPETRRVALTVGFGSVKFLANWPE